jgi:Flp pilus assembly pilin Flp
MIELAAADDALANTEYAVILSLLVIVTLATLILFGDGLVAAFSFISRQFADASDQAPAGKTLANSFLTMTYSQGNP